MRPNRPTKGIESTLRYSNRVSEHYNYESSRSPIDIPRAAQIQEQNESERLTQKMSNFDSNNESLFKYQGMYKPLKRFIKPQRPTQEGADQKQFWQLLEGVNSDHQPSEIDACNESKQTQKTKNQDQPQQEDRQWSFEDERSRPENPQRQQEEENPNQSRPIDVPYHEKTSKKESALPVKRLKSKSRLAFEKIQIKKIPQVTRVVQGKKKEKDGKNLMERIGLTFIRFPRGNDPIDETKKYPTRQTRIQPLRFWKNEKVDYKKDGVWVLRDNS